MVAHLEYLYEPLLSSVKYDDKNVNKIYFFIFPQDKTFCIMLLFRIGL